MPGIDDKIIICRCEEVTKDEIEQAIREGASTLRAVKLSTHAGMGLCQGRYCRKLIAGMLSAAREPSEIIPFTSRPPARTAKIAEFIEAVE
jgi:NAD(P)H-nitrite reductase large subunit